MNTYGFHIWKLYKKLILMFIDNASVMKCNKTNNFQLSLFIKKIKSFYQTYESVGWNTLYMQNKQTQHILKIIKKKSCFGFYLVYVTELWK